jgi:uncharacterized protein
MNTLTRVALRWAATLLAAYATVIVLLWWQQEFLIFRPHKLPADHVFAAQPDVQEVWIDVPGTPAARINALHLRQSDSRGVVFYLHGNGGSLEGWWPGLEPYRRARMDLFMIDYRGYGKSPGRIQSELQLMADVRAAWQHIEPLYAGKRRVFLGRSLGTGLAAQLAAEVQPEQTVLVSPFFSMQALAREHYPWVPGAVLRYPLRTDLALPQLRGDVLLIHGTRDTLIPAHHSQQLHALLPRAELLLVQGAGHNDLQRFGAYAERVTQMLLTP